MHRVRIGVRINRSVKLGEVGFGTHPCCSVSTSHVNNNNSKNDKGGTNNKHGSNSNSNSNINSNNNSQHNHNTMLFNGYVKKNNENIIVV